MDYVGACPKHDPHHHKAYSEPKESSPQIHLATRTPAESRTLRESVAVSCPARVSRSDRSASGIAME